MNVWIQKNKKRIFALIFALLIVAGSVMHLHYENTALQVTKKMYHSPALPLSFDSCTIAVVSDLHNSKSKKLTDSLVAALEDASPDLIAVTGDLIDAYHPDVDAAVSFIERIVPVAPIYYVTGNHEGALEDDTDLFTRLEDLGVNMLDNRNQEIKTGVYLAGVRDPAMQHAQSLEPDAVMRLYLEETGLKKNAFQILLAHRPEFIEDYAEAGADIVLSGHAHGGQIRLPLVGGLYSPGQGLFPRYTAGSYSQGETTMFVSRGLGSSMFPFRVNNRPELLLVSFQYS